MGVLLVNASVVKMDFEGRVSGVPDVWTFSVRAELGGGGAGGRSFITATGKVSLGSKTAVKG